MSKILLIFSLHFQADETDGGIGSFGQFFAESQNQIFRFIARHLKYGYKIYKEFEAHPYSSLLY
jgi:hypothetical protein